MGLEDLFDLKDLAEAERPLDLLLCLETLLGIGEMETGVICWMAGIPPMVMLRRFSAFMGVPSWRRYS